MQDTRRKFPGRRIYEKDGLFYRDADCRDIIGSLGGVLPGDYWKGEGGRWLGYTPNRLLAGLAKHAITEHGDGTITANPSIDVNQNQANPCVPTWHGYLERGIWREIA